MYVSPNDSELVAGYINAAKKFLKKDFSVPFPILLDTAGQVAEAYGVLKQSDSTSDVIASTFIIDRQGKIQLKYVGQDFADRPPIPLLLETLDHLKKPSKSGR